MTLVARLRKYLHYLLPPPRWRLTVILLLGIITGLGIHILFISNAVSYLSDDPEACINCHVMNPEYATWQKSSHGRVTVCNDCHVPHDNVFSKYFFKASDGLRHSTMFTFRLEPQVIQIKEAGMRAVQNNCIRCHNKLVDQLQITEDREIFCYDCHREVPHGRVRGLASAPYARVPGLKSVVPKWMED